MHFEELCGRVVCNNETFHGLNTKEASFLAVSNFPFLWSYAKKALQQFVYSQANIIQH